MSGPSLHPLHAGLLARWAAAPRPRDPRLNRLLDQALAGQGRLLRLSPRRLVLRLSLPEGDWLLKLDAPQRPFEPLRRALRAGPAVRERRNAERLARELSGFPQPALGEQPGRGFGLFARPWVEGRSARESLPAEAAAIGAGIARLHAAGWTDPDLGPADLLLPPGGPLLPLDLGHARVQARGATAPARRQADLARLLAGLPRALAQAALPALSESYARQAALPAKPLELLRAADALRRELLRRQSRRCLRECSDFSLDEDGGLLRRAAPNGAARELRLRGAAVAREAFRRLYEFELHGLRAAQAEACPGDGSLRLRLPTDAAVGAADGEALLELGADFARAGFGLSLEDPAHFALDASGRAWLADPRALLGALRT